MRKLFFIVMFISNIAYGNISFASTYLFDISVPANSLTCGTYNGTPSTQYCLYANPGPVQQFNVGDEINLNVNFQNRQYVPGSNVLSVLFAGFYDGHGASGANIYGNSGSGLFTYSSSPKGAIGSNLQGVCVCSGQGYNGSLFQSGPSDRRGFSVTGFSTQITVERVDPYPLLGEVVGYEVITPALSAPEPAAWGLLLLGFGGLGAALRSRRRADTVPA